MSFYSTGQTVVPAQLGCDIFKERSACVAFFGSWLPDWRKPYRVGEGEECCLQKNYTRIANGPLGLT